MMLDGLSQFSHVWLIFWFHNNGPPTDNEHHDNSLRASNSAENPNSNNDELFMPFKRKIRPPRLNGEKVGVLATRSPHRPVPVGLTAACVDKIEGDTVFLRGVDLIDGTPIIDIKPYIPQYDSIPNAVTPEWIHAPSALTEVVFEEKAEEQLKEYFFKLKKFRGKSVEDVRQTIKEVLLADPRSAYRKSKCAEELFGFHLDVLNIQCLIPNASSVHVVNVELLEDNDL